MPKPGAVLIPTVLLPNRARLASLYFDDLLHAQVLTFNPKYKEAEGALVGELLRLNADTAGNREFLAYLRNQGKFFCAEEEDDWKRNRNLFIHRKSYWTFSRARAKPGSRSLIY